VARHPDHRRVKPKKTRAYRPQTDGKVERLNRTLLTDWAHAQTYTSNEARTAALPDWLHTYNHHRAHTALGGEPRSAASTTSRGTTARTAPPARTAASSAV
jgi:transposase InsO family protein